jgi:hypothetical protein
MGDQCHIRLDEGRSRLPDPARQRSQDLITRSEPSCYLYIGYRLICTHVAGSLIAISSDLLIDIYIIQLSNQPSTKEPEPEELQNDVSFAHGSVAIIAFSTPSDQKSSQVKLSTTLYIHKHVWKRLGHPER